MSRQPSTEQKRNAIDRMVLREKKHAEKQGREISVEKTRSEYRKIAETSDNKRG